MGFGERPNAQATGGNVGTMRVAGLYEGSHPGRPPKWNEMQRQALRELAEQQGVTAGALLRHLRQNQKQPPVSVDPLSVT
jgi:hypothetical protein